MHLLLAALVVFQQAHSHPAPPATPSVLEVAARPVPPRTALGVAHDPVGTGSKDAQAFYDQGLAYLHSYVWIEAARSFNQALRLHPQIALASSVHKRRP